MKIYCNNRYEETRGKSVWQGYELPWENLLSRLALTMPAFVKNCKSLNTSVTYQKFAKAGRNKIYSCPSCSQYCLNHWHQWCVESIEKICAFLAYMWKGVLFAYKLFKIELVAIFLGIHIWWRLCALSSCIKFLGENLKP